MRSAIKPLVTLVLLLTCVAAGTIIFVERAALSNPLAQGLHRSGLIPSTTKSHDLLELCALDMLRLDAFTLDAQQRQQNIQHCLNFTNAVEAARPAQGFAGFIRAIALASSGRLEEAREALWQSQQQTPNEAWLAERRLDFVSFYLDPEQFLKELGFWQDITVAMHRDEAQVLVAELYYEYEEVNRRIPEIIEQKSPQIQTGMLRAIRRVGLN